MFFIKGRSAQIREKIEAIDLDLYLAKAQELFGLAEDDFEDAAREYRHFLYLVYWNKRLAGDTMVVPTKRADTLWHAYILYTRDYAEMCHNILGTFLHHSPDLEEGSPSHTYALVHTKKLHNEVYRSNKPGFDEDYFAFVDVSEPSRDSVSGSVDSSVGFSGEHPVSTAFEGHGGSFGGGGASGTYSSDSPSHSSSHSGSSSSSCGGDGGGCGGD